MAKGTTPAKRARRAEANRLRNKAYKTRLKSTIKKYENSLKDDNLEAAKEDLLQVTSLIDKSVSKGIMHKNTAARHKSKFNKQLNVLSK